MRLLLAAVCALVLAPAALAAESSLAKPRLTEARAVDLFVAHDKVADWLARYPPRPTTDADYDETARTWTVKVWSGEAGQIALGKVSDETGVVTEAWTGPQVAWKMARGYDGAFGGKKINSPAVWLAFCAAFVVGLADWRRLRSWRNLDLLVLLGFSISLWFFNRGEVFWSIPLAYPPLVYLGARLAWVGLRRRRPAGASRPLWPVWVLAAATVFLAGFRVGLNIEASNVIDVGYAGVIGAHRIANGESPYGHFPVQEDLKACGEADADGEIRERIQTNGRCESSNARGDTYGPVAYAAYLPGYWIFGWSGKWDDLPAAHLTSIVWDLLCLAGLALVGLRFGGTRLAATLAFAWVAYPFTQYVSNSNTNDAILPAFLIWGFWLVSSAPARGAFVALSGLTKFASFIVAPLWLTYRGSKLAFAAGFAGASVAALSVLLLEPSVVEAGRTFVERTVGWQLGRESPFSIWDWGQYHAAGVPDLHLVQRALQVALVVAAVVLAFVPGRKSPLQLAALTGALLVGFELVLTHWFYLYIPWFFPFAAIALLAAVPAVVAPEEAEEAGADRETRPAPPAPVAVAASE
jgi:hypothetical protein